METQELTLTLEQYEQIVPCCDIHFEGRDLHYFTPSRQMKWRADTLFTKEPDTVRWLSCMSPDDILLDVGANVGMYSILAAVGRDVQVIACEPESQNYGLLNRNILINDACDKIRSYCLALSDRCGLDEFYLSDFTPGGSCHTVGESLDFNLQPRPPSYVQGCIVSTLDRLIEDQAMPVPTHIKIDVDGIEHKVIHGMIKTLSNPVVKSVLIELNPGLAEHRALFDLMEEQGFHYFDKQLQESRQVDGPFKGIGNVIFYRPGWLAYEKLYAAQLGICHVRAAFSHVIERITSAQVHQAPTPYYFIEDVFPDAFYQYLLANLPADESYIPIDAAGLTTGNSYSERSIFQLNDASLEKLSGLDRPFWNQVALALRCSDFLNVNMQKFAPWLPECQQITESMPTMFPEALLVRDRTGYKLGPHTDAVDRVLSLLFYLPRDLSLESEGTALFMPVDPNFKCPGGPHYDFDDFVQVKRIPFKPNSLVAFVSTDQSFHGVPELTMPGVQRDLLGYMIKNPARLTS